MICGFHYSKVVVKDHVGVVELSSGIDYEILTPLEDLEWHLHDNRKEAGPAYLWVYHHITEKDQRLYGFDSLKAKQVFVDLISVDGMGCTRALKIMSSMAPEKLMAHIADGDVDALAQADGIGRKSGERIVTALKDKYQEFSTTKDLGTISRFSLMETTKYGFGRPGNVPPVIMEKVKEVAETAVLALMKLGYKKKFVQAVVSQIDFRIFFTAPNDPTAPIDVNAILQQVIKMSLPKLNAGDSNGS